VAYIGLGIMMLAKHWPWLDCQTTAG
jgi:hypothetical protein